MINEIINTMFIHTNHEEIIQLPIDHNHGVPQLQICPTRHIASPNEVEEAEVETDYKNLTVNSNPISVGCMKNKIWLVD